MLRIDKVETKAASAIAERFDDPSKKVFQDPPYPSSPHACGYAFQSKSTTTLNAIAGGLYDVTLSYDAFTPNEDGGCGGNGYIVAKQIWNLAVPNPP
jgi:hypothetical protein